VNFVSCVSRPKSIGLFSHFFERRSVDSVAAYKLRQPVHDVSRRRQWRQCWSVFSGVFIRAGADMVLD
jgi:hypothetical protein